MVELKAGGRMKTEGVFLAQNKLHTHMHSRLAGQIHIHIPFKPTGPDI